MLTRAALALFQRRGRVFRQRRSPAVRDAAGNEFQVCGEGLRKGRPRTMPAGPMIRPHHPPRGRGRARRTCPEITVIILATARDSRSSGGGAAPGAAHVHLRPHAPAGVVELAAVAVRVRDAPHELGELADRGAAAAALDLDLLSAHLSAALAGLAGVALDEGLDVVLEVALRPRPRREQARGQQPHHHLLHDSSVPRRRQRRARKIERAKTAGGPLERLGSLFWEEATTQVGHSG